MLSPGETLMGVHYQFGLQTTNDAIIGGHYARQRTVGLALTLGSPPPEPPLPLDAPDGDTWLWWERVNFLPDGLGAFQAPDGRYGVRETHSRRAAGSTSGALWFVWQGAPVDGDDFQVAVGYSAVVLLADTGAATPLVDRHQLAMV